MKTISRSGRNKTWLSLILISLACEIQSECPSADSVAPCKCENGNGNIDSLTCDEISLSRLTTVLRTEMCGQSIERFRLMNSNISYLPSNLFVKVYVQDIHISFTSINSFSNAARSAFYGQEEHLQSLSLHGCFLLDNLEWQMIGELKALSYLDLSSNGLTRIPQHWFESPPPNLRSLIMKRNKISVLRPGAFSRMRKLVELDLSENQISKLSRDIFPMPGNFIVFLRLSYNYLSSLPDNLFSKMMGLRRVYLFENKLKTLQRNLWAPIWGDLDLLDVGGNNFICGQDMSWISELRPPKRLYGISLSSNFTRLECNT